MKELAESLAACSHSLSHWSWSLLSEDVDSGSGLFWRYKLASLKNRRIEDVVSVEGEAGRAQWVLS